jgi:preprotein translocase subunit SecY
MANVQETFRNIFKIHELRQRIIYTLVLLVIVRIGAHITIPGINSEIIQQVMKGGGSSDTLLGLYDFFVGGALGQAAIFGLGIMPYISASIVLQLAGAVIPYFQKLQREGEEGRKKINQLTRYGTVILCVFQGFAFSSQFMHYGVSTGTPAVLYPGIGFLLTSTLVLTAGTMFLMWMGEQITEKGLGNGISLIIFIGIVDRFPYAVLDEINRGPNIVLEIVILAIMGLIIAGVVLVTQGTRRIPVQYAKRVVGRKIYGGVTQYIPLRVNTAGVMPIIFAQSIVMIPSTIAQFFYNNEFITRLTQNYFAPRTVPYAIIEALLIIFFTYFYTAIAFNPQDVAENMKKQGGFIPGIRPGKQTSEFIDNILTKITLPGSVFLAIIAILPLFAERALGVNARFASFFGGTSLLIMVGVALDTLQQIESHLLMRHYDGFMKSGKLRGRRQ